MSRQIFVNLPVKDLKKTMEFFSKLGFTFNQQFTDENAACMIVSQDIFVMLLLEKFFQGFTQKTICDTRGSAEAIISLSAESRQAVDNFANKALSAGAMNVSEPKEMGSMYSRDFFDLDGHMWEVLWMDPSTIESY